jgi:hypothetical protein
LILLTQFLSSELQLSFNGKQQSEKEILLGKCSRVNLFDKRFVSAQLNDDEFLVSGLG